MISRRRRITTTITMLAIVAMVAVACGPSAAATPTPAASASTGGAAATPTESAAVAASAPTEAMPTSQPTEAAMATQPATSASSGSVKNPDTLIEATIGEPESLDPAWAYDTASGEAIFNVYETLLFPKKDSTTEFVPMLATSWDISSDGLTYTFHIREGVKFQDGQDLTPQDVAYSFWRGLIQDRAGGPQWILLQPFFGLDVQSFENGVVNGEFNGDWTQAVQAVQQTITYDNAAGTVTMHLKQPYGPMLQILTGTWASVVSMPWVISQGGWDGDPATAQKYHDPSAEQDELFKVMNGTGPFKLDRWAPGEELDLVRNDSYWLSEPLWDGGPTGPASASRAVIKYISEWGTRFATFQTGDADLVYVPRQYVSQVDPLVAQTCDASGSCTDTNADGTLRLFKDLPSVSATAIYFNQDVNTTGGNNTIGSGVLDGNGVPPDFFSDIHIRQAFNYCFDWDTYIKEIWGGEAEQALGPVINGLLGYDASQAHYTFDLDKCAQAFKASTLTSDSGQSLWDTGFYLQYVYNTGNDQRKTAGEILQQSLQQVNPKFQLSVVDEPFALLLKDQVDGRMPIFMLGWLEDYHDPNDWVVPYLSSAGTYASSQHFAADLQDQLDQLINQGVQESDPDQRAQIYGQLQNLAYENALDIFVVQPLGRQYEQTWVNGYYYNPIYPGIYFYPLSKGG